MSGKQRPLSKSKPDQGIRGRNQARILEVAVELFSRKGFDGTRMAEIAKASALPKANIYYYFASKEAIYTRLIDQVLAGWDDALEHISDDREPRDAISDYIKAKLHYSRIHASESRLFASEMLRGGQFISQQQKDHMREITHEKASVIEGWIKDGRFARVEPHHFLIMLWSTTQYYADFSSTVASTLNKKKLGKADFEQAQATIIETVLNNCLT